MQFFAFTFGVPAMLWGMSLAAAPLVIHMLNRQRYRESDWAAMEWLLAALRKNHRRVRFEQWLLLAIRTLVLLLVVLAMTKPTFETLGASLLSIETPATHNVIVFDNSSSMHYAATDQSRGEKAKGLAQQVLDEAQKGDLASVVVLGNPPTIVVGEPSPYLADVAEEIESIKPQDGYARVEAGVDLLLEVLKKSRSSRKQVFIVTDLQRSGWLGSADGGPQESDASTKALGDKLKAVSAQAATTILDVGVGDSANLAVVG
ncbi:MAG: BatA domain-containing protein, partial [Planctomycetia bacterium]